MQKVNCNLVTDVDLNPVYRWPTSKKLISKPVLPHSDQENDLNTVFMHREQTLERPRMKED